MENKKAAETKEEKSITISIDAAKEIINDWFLQNFHNRQGISDTAIFNDLSIAKSDLIKRFENI